MRCFKVVKIRLLPIVKYTDGQSYSINYQIKTNENYLIGYTNAVGVVIICILSTSSDYEVVNTTNLI